MADDLRSDLEKWRNSIDDLLGMLDQLPDEGDYDDGYSFVRYEQGASGTWEISFSPHECGTLKLTTTTFPDIDPEHGLVYISQCQGWSNYAVFGHVGSHADALVGEAMQVVNSWIAGSPFEFEKLRDEHLAQQVRNCCSIVLEHDADSIDEWVSIAREHFTELKIPYEHRQLFRKLRASDPSMDPEDHAAAALELSKP